MKIYNISTALKFACKCVMKMMRDIKLKVKMGWTDKQTDRQTTISTSNR